MRRLFLLAFIWGWSFLFIKVAVEGLTPSSVAFGRIALGAVVLHLVLRTQDVALPTDRSTWRHFAVVAVFGSALPFTMLAWGEERITSALTAVLNASTPIFTALAAAMLLKERLRPIQIFGLAVGFVGVAVAAGIGGDDLSGSSVAGSLASVGAGACYGLSFVYARKHLTGLAPLVAATGQLTAASLLLAPLAVGTSLVSGIHLSPTRVLALVLLGVVGTGGAYVLYYRILGEMGPTRSSLVTYLIPAVAIAVGVVVLDEPFELSLIVGALIIIAGIALVTDRFPGRRVPPAVVATGALVLLAGLLVGCGSGGSTASGGCGPIVRESLDPNHLVHVLGNATDVEYSSDPPTSGPHQPSPGIEGALEEPLTRPLQVGVLEEGGVVIQYQPGLDAAGVTDLEALAGPGVVVAPAPELEDPVVATAWTYKRTCDRASIEPLQEFIDERSGQGPDRPS